jgi:hypothetical protein
MDTFTTIGAELVRLFEHTALVLIATDPVAALRFALMASELRRRVKQ